MSVPNATLSVISLDTACAITDISRSTWRRRIGKENNMRATDDARGRVMLLWSAVAPYICVPIEPEDKQLILLADDGVADAQNDIGQLFLIAGKHKAAFYWFGQAAQQNNPDAMQWIGLCHVNGKGVPADENLGIMWIARAAALGHVIAQAQMQGLIGRAVVSRPGLSLILDSSVTSQPR
jgi:TPR repeat protein